MNTDNSLVVENVIVIPAFNEQDALPLLVKELMPLLSIRDAVMVIDDSAPETAELTAERCRKSAGEWSQQLSFSATGTRGGRGAAVRTGFSLALLKFPRMRFLLECDADGSHRAIDIQKVLSCSNQSDVIVGSRYMEHSEIIGWSVSRKVQSRILNWLIPRIIKVELQDVTNGLRRYSRRAVERLLDHDAVSTAFIYLTEEALVLSRYGMRFHELPIVFAERRAGASSVSFKELRESLRGLLRIISLTRTLQLRNKPGS